MRRDDLLIMDDDALLRTVEMDTFRGSGPGGQHRNTTDSAVRLKLPESDISATASEHRSQHRNRALALRRLRVEIALRLRRDPPPGWKGPWKIGQRDRRYPLFIAVILDQLAAHDYQVGDASTALGISTNRLVRILADDNQLWAQVNRERQQRGYSQLRMP